MSGPAAGARSVSRLVLGTVQFGVPYGRRRSLGTMRFGSVARILDAAWDRGVRAFDTAEAYGLAAPRLARWLHARAHVADASVVTKVRLTDAAQPAAVRAAVARFAECLVRAPARISCA